MRIRSVIQVLFSDATSKAVLVIVGIAMIRFMSEVEYATYIFTFSVATLVSQAVAGSFNRIYIVGFDRLGLETSLPSLLLLQVLIVTIIFIVAFPLSDYFYDLYWLVYALVIAICFSDFSKTHAQRKLSFVRFSLIEIIRSTLTGSCLAIVIYIVRFDLKSWQVLFIHTGIMLLVFVVFSGSMINLKDGMKIGESWRLIMELSKRDYKYLFGYFLLIALFIQVDVIMLRLISNGYELATYGSAFRYYSVLALALGAVNTVFLPLIQQIQDYGDLQRLYSKHRLISVLFVPVVILAGWGAQWVIPWVDVGKYANAVTVFRILCASIIISFAFSPHVNLIMRFEKFKFLFVLIIVGLLINVILNLALIPSFGATGVAVATLLAAASVTISIYFKSLSVSAELIKRAAV